MNSIPQKRCTKCGVEKSPDDFGWNTSKVRLHTQCKFCRNERNKAYQKRKRQEDPVYRQRMIESERRCRLNNPEGAKASQRGSYQKRAEYYRQKSREYAKANPDKVRQLRERNRAQLCRTQHLREARKRGNGGSYTVQEWNELCERYDYRCLRCGEQKPLTVDHVIPISKGGPNDISNLQPLCGSCNSTKRDKTIDYRVKGD